MSAAKTPNSVPQRAMVLAAGLGERMRPITDNLPKPLVELHGTTLLDLILDRIDAAGVPEVVINLYYLGEMIEAHLKNRKQPHITFSPEAKRLETGGGVRNALPLLGEDPLFAINGDVCWLDGPTPALRRLSDAWDDENMDVLLLMQPTAFAVGYDGAGDFILSPEGCLRRRGEREVAPFVFAGIQILHPRIFKDTPEGPFSLNLIYDKAIETERLWGLRHDGEWFHIGTPEGLQEVEEAFHPLANHSVQK